VGNDCLGRGGPRDKTIEIINVRIISSFQSPHSALRFAAHRQKSFALLISLLAMDFRDNFRGICTKRILACRFIRVQGVDASGFCLVSVSSDFVTSITGHFPAVGIRKVTVGNEAGQLPELRFDPYSR